MESSTLTSSALSGLSLTTGVARDVADGVPVVKQVLGLAARVVSLAQHIDKNRTDLHALADRAKRMDAAITAALGDREPDGHLLHRLEDMNATLRAIEQRFSKHVKRGRVRRMLEYIFTVQHEIERLQGEFDDRLSELQTASNIEASVVARENSRFIGEFRNIRHSEINLLRRIKTESWTNDGRTITYNLATCEGSNQMFIVRYVVSSSRGEDTRRNIDRHEKILEELSFIQNRHPVLPYLYGRNNGPMNNRFSVLCTGNIRPLRDVFPEGRATLSILGPIVARLGDASCHLRTMGAAWVDTSPGIESIYLDKQGEPRIGLFDDLSYASIRESLNQAMHLALKMQLILDGSTVSDTAETHFPPTEFRSALWHMQLFGALTDAGYCTRRIENSVRRANIFGLVPLTQESLTFLHKCGTGGRSAFLHWGNILLSRAMGNQRWDGSVLRAIYATQPPYEDVISALCIEDDGETMRSFFTVFKIPPFAAKDTRKRLGIPGHPWTDMKPMRSEILRQSRLGETLVECTGWSPDGGLISWQFW